MFLGWDQRQVPDWQPLPYDLIQRLLEEYGSFYCGDLLFLEQLERGILAYGFNRGGRRMELACFSPDHVTLLHWPKNCQLRSGIQFLLGSVSKEEAADYLYCQGRPGLQIDYSGEVINGPHLWPAHLSRKEVVQRVSQTLWQSYYLVAKPLGIDFDSPALVDLYTSDLSPPRADSAYVSTNLVYFPKLKNPFVIEKLHESLRSLPEELGLQPQHFKNYNYLRVVVHPPTNLHQALLSLEANL